MKSARTKFKKRIFIWGSILIILPILIILFISPITKYVIEKYSIKWTGRQVKMDRAYVNPFTGHVHFSNLKIYEATGDSIFFSATGVSADFAIWKMLFKTYEIKSLILDEPRGMVIHNGGGNFNFTDLVEKFKPKSTGNPKPPVHFNILNVKINNGIFYFQAILSKINYFIKDVNFESSGKWWNVDTVAGKFSFTSGTGTGDINGTFTVNLNTLDYHYAVIAHKFSLDILEQYMKDLTSYGTLSANLDANLKTTGNFKDENNQDTKGRFQINDLHFGKTREEDYLSFQKFVMAINEVNPEKHIYKLDSVILTHPYFKFEKYDYLDNMETMFGEKGANVSAVDADKQRFNLILELGHYLIDISKNFFESAYKVNNLALIGGDIKFNDYSQSEKFSIEANPLYINADSIDQSKGWVNIHLKTGIKPYGNIALYASINPRDSEDFDVTTHLTGMSLAMMNPYFITFTSYPFNGGTVEFHSNWKVRKGNIKSDNHILIIDPSVTKRLKNNDDKWLPMGLIMALVRGNGDVIDYQIPVTGDLKNPKFHLKDVVFSTLKNIFIKPPTTPYRVMVKTRENIIEKSFTMKWGIRQSSMQSGEEKFANKIAKFLSENPTASIIITPQQYETKEKEYILFFEAKKKYYLSLNTGKNKAFNESDSEYVDKISVKDSSFVHYLNKHLTHTLVFTIQDKCSEVISPGSVNARFAELNKARKNTFLSSFKGKGVDNRITFAPSLNVIPYNGFSFYKIEYKGELPGYLIKAYNEMGELNNKNPREKYQKERGKMKLPHTGK